MKPSRLLFSTLALVMLAGALKAGEVARTSSAIAAFDGHLWAAVGDRVQSFMLTANTKPRAAGEAALPATPLRLTAFGEGVVAMMGQAGTVVIGAETNGSLPVAWLSAPPSVLAAAERNGLLALACGPRGVWLFSITNPSLPVLLGGFPGATEARDVGFVASLLCVADGTHGLKILDLSNPARPEVVGVFAPSGAAEVDHLAISTTLLVAAQGRWVRLLDASDPRHPVVTAERQLPAPVRGLTLGRLRVWAACGPAGAFELDLGHQLRTLREVQEPGIASVAVDGERVFVARGTDGWQEVQPLR